MYEGEAGAGMGGMGPGQGQGQGQGYAPSSSSQVNDRSGAGAGSSHTQTAPSPEYLFHKQQACLSQQQRRGQVLEEVVRLLCAHVGAVLTLPQVRGTSVGGNGGSGSGGSGGSGSGSGSSSSSGSGSGGSDGALAIEVDRLGSIIAHKLSSLSSVAKGHTYKSRRNLPEGTIDAGKVFQAAASVVAAAACNPALGRLAVVRSRCVIFLHRMITCMGGPCLEALAVCMPALIANCDVDDGRSCQAYSGEDAGSSGAGFHGTGAGSEEVLQLLNQAMLEFQGQALPLIDGCLGPALEKCWVLARAGVGAAGSEGEGGAVAEAAHVEGERQALQKQPLVFLSHVATQLCDAALFSDCNRPRYLELIFNEEILEGLRGGRGNLNMASSVPLRKAAVGTLSGLVKAWFWPGGVGGGSEGVGGHNISINNNTSSNSSSSSSSGSSSSSNSSSSAVSLPHPPIQLCEALWVFIRDQALPTLLGSLAGTVTFGRQALNLRDAAVQSLLTDVGGLVWTLVVAFSLRCRMAGGGLGGAGSAVGGVGGVGYHPRSLSPLLAAVSLPVQLGEIATAVGWPSPAVLALQQVVGQVDGSVGGAVVGGGDAATGMQIPLGTFKETFRKFIRGLSGGK